MTLLVPWWPNDGRAVADGRLVERAGDDELAAFSAECFLQPAAFCRLMQAWSRSEHYVVRCRYVTFLNIVHGLHAPYVAQLKGNCGSPDCG